VKTAQGDWQKNARVLPACTVHEDYEVRKVS
jgi:hypothetical protein